MLIQIPHAFFVREAERLGFSLPAPGSYGVGMVFFPRNDEQRERCRKVMNRVIREEGFEVLGWRDTPIDANAIGQVARASRPYIEQVFIAAARQLRRTDAAEAAAEPSRVCNGGRRERRGRAGAQTLRHSQADRSGNHRPRQPP